MVTPDARPRAAHGDAPPRAVVTLDDLTVTYRGHPALHHVSGWLAAGSLTAVIGPNGAGKSTLLKSIMGLLPAASGQIAVATPPRRIAYLPQLADIDRGFPITVRDCVLLGCWPEAGAWGGVRAASLARVAGALAAVGLQGFEQRPVGALSSGQLQRVLFARLLVQDAELILLDEPFNAMDSRTTAALLALVHQWHAEGRTVVAVLHDDAQVRAHFPQALLLARQCVGWGPTGEVLTDARLQQARDMAEAWDESAGPCRTTAPDTAGVPGDASFAKAASAGVDGAGRPGADASGVPSVPGIPGVTGVPGVPDVHSPLAALRMPA